MDTKRATYSIPEWATLLGISKQYAYLRARETGEIAGVRVLTIGRRMVVPRAAADRVLNGAPVQR